MPNLYFKKNSSEEYAIVKETETVNFCVSSSKAYFWITTNEREATLKHLNENGYAPVAITEVSEAFRKFIGFATTLTL